MAKRKREDCAAGAPLWLATFADMVTLLLAFFVMLLSFSSIQESKFNEAVHSLQGAFSVMQSPPTVIEQRIPVVPELDQSEIQEVVYEVSKIREVLAEEGLQDEMKVSLEKDGIAIRISTPFLFPPAKANLRPESVPVLDKLAAALGRTDNQIRVEGHTDNIPIATDEFPSNWELSTARALSVLKYLQSHQVRPGRLSAAGFGEFKPVASNADAAGRRQNRRVEIFVQYKELQGNTLEGTGMVQGQEARGG